MYQLEAEAEAEESIVEAPGEAISVRIRGRFGLWSKRRDGWIEFGMGTYEGEYVVISLKER